MLQPLRGHPQAGKIRENQKYSCSISNWMPEVNNKCTVRIQHKLMISVLCVYNTT